MPLHKTAIGPEYTIWFADKTRKGTAYELLDAIRRNAGSIAIQKLTTEKYAAALISDAAYFLPKGLFELLKNQPYESDFDRALRYLAEMATSGVRILTKE